MSKSSSPSIRSTGPSAREKMRWNFDDKVFEASNRVLNIVLDAVNKIRSLKSPVDTNERWSAFALFRGQEVDATI
uniref:Uncharacterized protein n=1 Tax=Zea mays TaxID=4577 RepID=B6T031_MAIZE|nr:hypothetical protein [Zea mays]